MPTYCFLEITEFAIHNMIIDLKIFGGKVKLYKTHIRVVTDFGTDIKIENSLVKILANNFEEAKNNIEKLIMNDEISIIANKPFSEVLINVDREYEESFEDSPSFSEEILEDVYIN